jgi:hypothetical protein
MSGDENVGRSYNMRNENWTFERVEKCRYLEKILTKQNSLQEEIKEILQSGNVCYHLVQNLLFSILLSKY